MKFYTYLIRDPRPLKNNEPIYAGKGQGGRAKSHLKDASNPWLRNIINKITVAGLEPIIEIIDRFELEKEAFISEISLIAQYGRRDLGTGTLCNFTDGGEGPSGSLGVKAALKRLNADPEFRRKHSEATKAMHRDPNFAKRRDAWLKAAREDPEHKLAHSERMKKLHCDPEYAKARDERSAKAMTELHKRPDFAKKISDHARKLGQSSSERVKAMHKDPKYAKIYKDNMIKLNDNPDFVKKRNEAMDRVHKDPKFLATSKATMDRLNADPEFRKEVSNRMKRLNADPEHQAKCTAGMRKKSTLGELKWSEERKREHSAILRSSEAMANRNKRPGFHETMSDSATRGWITRRANLAKLQQED